MSDNQYQPGDMVPLEATFRNAAGTPTNTTVTLTVRDPTGAATTPTPTNTSTGVYHYDYTLASNAPAGVWEYIFYGSGAVTAKKRGTFVVETESLVTQITARALVSLMEARDYVYNDPTDNSNDRRLIARINTYSEAVWKYTRREWKPSVAAVRTFRYRGASYLPLAPYDLVSASSIVAYTDRATVDQVTLTAPSGIADGDYNLRPSGGDPLTGTYRWIDFDNYTFYAWPRSGFDITVTGNWGIPTVPDDVKLAVLVAVDDSIRNPEGATARQFGELTITEEPGLTEEERRWRALPGESRALLAPYLDSIGLAVA